MNTEAREERLKALMCAGLDGSAEAQRTLLLELSRHLRGYFRSKLTGFRRTAEDTEDLVQDVLIAVHTRRDTYDRSQLFTPWVFAIARYKFVDYLRRTATMAHDVPVESAGEFTTRSDHESVESSHDLDTLLSRLKPKARRALRYMKLQGLSVEETAERTGMSQSAVKVSVHRSLKALSAWVKKEGQR